MSLLLLLRGSGTPTPSGYRITDIPDSLLSTGKHVLVWNGTNLAQRVTTEGTPVVLVSGQLRLLQSGETLQS